MHLSVPLASLWWMMKGDWKRAHDLVDKAEGRIEAWVHAHLHRVEGDQAERAAIGTRRPGASRWPARSNTSAR